MKKTLLLLLMATIMVFSYAIDDRIPRPIAHLKNIQPYNVDYQQDLVLLRNQNFIWIYSIFNPWSPRLEAVFTSSALIEDLNLLGDNQLYVCSEEPSNTISSVDTLSYPGKIFFTNPVIGNKIAREGSLLYVADRLRGIDIIDIGKGGMRELKSTFSEKWGIRDLLAE
ncbi:MAG: hypothetical protein PHW38_03820, partial [Candidatus Cloacimonetes bacterium]